MYACSVRTCGVAVTLAWILRAVEVSANPIASGAGWNADAASGWKAQAADPNDVHTVHPQTAPEFQTAAKTRRLHMRKNHGQYNCM